MRTFYQCNPELFEKCKKTHCQAECTLTTFKKYAKTDEFGNPIIASSDDLLYEEQEQMTEKDKLYADELRNKALADYERLDRAINELEQQPCEMTAEEYRQRMIQAFHNADTDRLIAICVLPTEKEFEHLEWLLKNHYKKQPCEDCISRQETISAIQDKYYDNATGIDIVDIVAHLPSVTPKAESEK